MEKKNSSTIQINQYKIIPILLFSQYNDDRYRAEQERLSRLETIKVRHILEHIDAQSSQECSLNVQAQWDFETNVNEVTQVHAVSLKNTWNLKNTGICGSHDHCVFA